VRYGHLGTEHGVTLCEPPHTKPVEGVGLSLLVFPSGHKENGGIFCHSNSWAIVAEALLGRGDRAYDCYRSYLPARYNDSAEIHQVEPHVYCQFTHGKASPRLGQARNPWLTGTASWTYAAVTPYLLGIQPVLDGLRVNPCLPTAWESYEVRRAFRGKQVTIRVSNPSHVSTGIVSLTLNGLVLDGDVVPADALTDADNLVEAVLG
jgi:cellobiose phosphorylase